jgi:hypothetical protein
MKIELKRHAPFSHAEKNGPMAMYTKNGDVPKVMYLYSRYTNLHLRNGPIEMYPVPIYLLVN